MDDVKGKYMVFVPTDNWEHPIPFDSLRGALALYKNTKDSKVFQYMPEKIIHDDMIYNEIGKDELKKLIKQMEEQS